MTLPRCLLLLALGACASAQHPQVPPPDPPVCEREVARWPSVEKEVRLEVPPDAPDGLHAVKMSVSIAADGRVSAVRLVEAAGPPFDETARTAMGQFLFNPGRDRDDRPIACTITYRYMFTRAF